MALDEPRRRDRRYEDGDLLVVISPMDARKVGDFIIEIMGGALMASPLHAGVCSLKT